MIDVTALTWVQLWVKEKKNNPTKKGTQIYRKSAQEVGDLITDPLFNNGHPKHLR